MSTIDQLYESWLEASDQLKEAKQKELDLRNQICDIVLSEKIEGAVTVKEHGYKVVATAKVTRSIDRIVLEAIEGDLTSAERDAIDYKPSLKLKEYKHIEATGGKLLEAVTVKPAQASLKIEPLGE